STSTTPEAGAAWLSAWAPAGATAGASGTPAGAAAGADGTAAGTSAAACAAGGGASGVDCSWFHSIHRSNPTIIQASHMTVRVWFIGRAGSFAGKRRRVGGRRGGRGGMRGRHCAVRGWGRQRTGAPEQLAAGLAQRRRTGAGGRGPGHQHVVAAGQLAAQQ